MTLVHLHLRRGEALAESRLIEGTEIYFCAKDRCPHYQGQLGLLPDTATMHCALVQYTPDRTCQPYYLETAEHLDHARRQTWQERLDEAEAFEKSLGGTEAPQFEAAFRGRCDVARAFMPGRGRRHHAALSEVTSSTSSTSSVSSISSAANP
jgi:hypothetical protein